MTKKKPEKDKTGVWTPRMDAVMKKMASQGKTRAEIAASLSVTFGKSITKNAVVGRCHRLGVTTVKPNLNTRSSLKNTAVYGYTPAGKDAPAIKESSAFKGPAYHIDRARNKIRIVADAPKNPGRPGGCQYLHGEAKDRNFCGAPTVQGREAESGSWCAEHYRVVYERVGRLVPSKAKSLGFC